MKELTTTKIKAPPRRQANASKPPSAAKESKRTLKIKAKVVAQETQVAQKFEAGLTNQASRCRVDSGQKPAAKIDDNESLIRSDKQTPSHLSTPLGSRFLAESPAASDFVLSEMEIRALKSPCPTQIEELAPEMPAYDPTKDYYSAYWELYMQNEQLMADLNE